MGLYNVEEGYDMIHNVLQSRYVIVYGGIDGTMMVYLVRVLLCEMKKKDTNGDCCCFNKSQEDISFSQYKSEIYEGK